jgi:hypothetical protein
MHAKKSNVASGIWAAGGVGRQPRGGLIGTPLPSQPPAAIQGDRGG